MTQAPPLRVVGLFAGIGGFELGFERAGHSSALLVDNALASRAVLRERFPNVDLAADVVELDALPSSDVVCAGFPCQDLSSVGRKTGIEGTRSSLIGEVFRLIAPAPPEWLVLENVPFLLQLGGGDALRLITTALQELGYAWAYRVIDSQAFGLPQRRRRWYLVASRTHDPRDVLLAGDASQPPMVEEGVACGFYWTEGYRALGWAVDALPPIKGGSSVGVPSPPAIFMPDKSLVTPDLRDAERLQGFEADWTRPAENAVKRGYRWQLVGNAVSVNVAEWLGGRLTRPGRYDPSFDLPISDGRWPYAAWGTPDGATHASRAGIAPVWLDRPSLLEFLEHPTTPLSPRAAAGFLRRAKKGSLRFPQGFLDAVQAHIEAHEHPSLLAA